MLLVPLLELRDHLRARAVDRLHNVFVLAGPALRNEDHQVEMRGLVLAQCVLDELRSADTAAALSGPPERPRHLVLRLLGNRSALETAEAAKAFAERAPALLGRRVYEPFVDVHLAWLVASAREGVVVVAERV